VLTRYHRCHLHVNMAPLTVEERLLIKILLIKKVEFLARQYINQCWDIISQKLVHGAIDQRSKRLLLVARCQGGHTEHRFH